MKNKTILIAAIAVIGIVALCVAAYFLFAGAPAVEESVGVPDAVGEPAVVIVRTKDGYEPREVTIKQGDIVRFSNESGEFHWPASDLHPTHGVYPEFDPLRPIADGEDWQFRFDQVGVWNFHDHIRANKTGTITVTE